MKSLPSSFFTHLAIAFAAETAAVLGICGEIVKSSSNGWVTCVENKGEQEIVTKSERERERERRVEARGERQAHPSHDHFAIGAYALEFQWAFPLTGSSVKCIMHCLIQRDKPAPYGHPFE